jgi:hypothetical protein
MTRARLATALLLVLSACGAELRAESSRSVIARDGGLPPDAVHEVVRAHVPAVRACYEQFAKAEGRPMGVVRVGWQIEPSGAVANVQIVATTLHSSSIEGCIAEDVARWQFPKSPRATEVGEYPFTF